MQPTGIVRKLDDLGRIVIPKSMRKARGMVVGDPIEFYVNGDDIILRKYVPGCIFCGGTERITMFRDKRVCQQCKDGIGQV